MNGMMKINLRNMPKKWFFMGKKLCCVWRDHRSIIHFKFLNRSQTHIADLYFQRPRRVHESILRKRPSLMIRKYIVILLDNTRPHLVKLTQKIKMDFSWSVLHDPSYSTNFAPSDSHLFRLLKMLWMTKGFLKKIEWKCLWKTFFSPWEDSKSYFYLRGTQKLSDKCQEGIQNNHQYTIYWN